MPNMKNAKKKVMAMLFAVMTLMSASAFAAAPAYNYSENGDFEAVVVRQLAKLFSATFIKSSFSF